MVGKWTSNTGTITVYGTKRTLDTRTLTAYDRNFVSCVVMGGLGIFSSGAYYWNGAGSGGGPWAWDGDAAHFVTRGSAT